MCAGCIIENLYVFEFGRVQGLLTFKRLVTL